MLDVSALRVYLGTVGQSLARNPARTALCVVLVFLQLSACSFVSTRTPKETEAGRTALHASGVPTSDIEVQAAKVSRLPGLVIVESASDLPGVATPIHTLREVLDARIGPSQEVHVRASIAESKALDIRCVITPEAMSAMTQTMDALYRQNPMAAFPADVRMTLVPRGIEVRRTAHSWRFGRTAVFSYWFSCNPPRGDESLMEAFMTLAHELTHAAVAYRGMEAESNRDIVASEKIADGAMACFYLLMPPPLGEKLRHSDEARVIFRDPSGRPYVDSKDALCNAWRAKMSELPN